jgi:hypothetical protein
VWAEQAIFTSLSRRGKSGYHLVSRSPGVTDAEAAAISTWSPSHGALVVDGDNGTSVNFHPLPGGRFALSRTCQGTAEYSGRGGRQLYTHALILDDRALKRADNLPLSVYRDALALGYLHFRPDPAETPRPVPLSATYPARDHAYWIERAGAFGNALPGAFVQKLTSRQSVELPFAGDRISLAECLIGLVPPEARLHVSFTTSLRPSVVRHYQLVLVGPGS